MNVFFVFFYVKGFSTCKEHLVSLSLFRLHPYSAHLHGFLAVQAVVLD